MLKAPDPLPSSSTPNSALTALAEFSIVALIRPTDWALTSTEPATSRVAPSTQAWVNRVFSWSAALPDEKSLSKVHKLVGCQPMVLKAKVTPMAMPASTEASMVALTVEELVLSTRRLPLPVVVTLPPLIQALAEPNTVLVATVTFRAPISPATSLVLLALRTTPSTTLTSTSPAADTLAPLMCASTKLRRSLRTTRPPAPTEALCPPPKTSLSLVSRISPTNSEAPLTAPSICHNFQPLAGDR